MYPVAIYRVNCYSFWRS